MRGHAYAAGSSGDAGGVLDENALVFQDNPTMSHEAADVGVLHDRLEIKRLGLVLQGKCTNSMCAFNDKMVNMCLGTGTFELAYEQSKCVCPKCACYCLPETCLFVGCWWKVVGVLREMGNKEPRKFATDWRCTSSLRYDIDHGLELIDCYAIRFVTKSEMPLDELQPIFDRLDSFALKRLVLEYAVDAERKHQVAFMKKFKQRCFTDIASPDVWNGVPAYDVIVSVLSNLSESSVEVQNFVQLCEKRALLQTMSTRIGSVWEDIIWALPEIWQEDDVLLEAMARRVVYDSADIPKFLGATDSTGAVTCPPKFYTQRQREVREVGCFKLLTPASR